jgi:hypothetical protein
MSGSIARRVLVVGVGVLVLAAALHIAAALRLATALQPAGGAGVATSSSRMSPAPMLRHRRPPKKRRQARLEAPEQQGAAAVGKGQAQPVVQPLAPLAAGGPVRFFIDEGYFLEGETEILRAHIAASGGRLTISGESTGAFLSVKGYYAPDKWDVYITMRSVRAQVGPLAAS